MYMYVMCIHTCILSHVCTFYIVHNVYVHYVCTSIMYMYVHLYCAYIHNIYIQSVYVYIVCMYVSMHSV